MHLVQFTCDGFRSLRNTILRPGPHKNILWGANAQGKTTVLEAILFTATSKSHRTTMEQELVRHDSDRFSAAAEVQKRDRITRLETHWWQGAKRVKVNGVAQTRLSDILGQITLVLFCPEDVALINGGASLRRRFLDMTLSQSTPVYLAALQHYRQALRQRNEMLRTRTADAALLEAWDAQLATHGAVLMRERARFVEVLSTFAAEAYVAVSGAETLSLRYRPSVAEPEGILAALERSRASDLRFGTTSHGPHRDDMTFRIGETSARQYASQGQRKSAALALKLAEMRWLTTTSGEQPILLLDEVLAELDADRAMRFFEAVGNDIQCLITTTETRPRPELFGETAQYFAIADGNVSAGAPR